MEDQGGDEKGTRQTQRDKQDNKNVWKRTRVFKFQGATRVSMAYCDGMIGIKCSNKIGEENYKDNEIQGLKWSYNSRSAMLALLPYCVDNDMYFQFAFGAERETKSSQLY